MVSWRVSLPLVAVFASGRRYQLHDDRVTQ